jgi:cholesterol oxidase
MPTASGLTSSHDSVFNPDLPPRAKRPLKTDTPSVHPFTTPDGTALRLTRYRGGDKGPVMLVHGLGVSSRIFSTDTIDTNLVEFLFAGGHDVWLLDFRSSCELPASATHYTGDVIATEDYPAAVATVQRETGAPAIDMVVHCWGATTFTMAMLAGLQGVRSAVISQISAHVYTPTMTRIKTGLHVPQFLDAIGVDSLTAYVDTHADWKDRLFDAALKLYPIELEERCRSPVCHRITFLYAPLYEHDQLNELTHTCLHELFGVASIGAFEHLARIANAERIVDARGEDRYLAHLDRLAIPITFLHGAENACFLPRSTELTYETLRELNGPDRYARHEIPGYGHIDCIFGANAARDVFPRITEHLASVG